MIEYVIVFSIGLIIGIVIGVLVVLISFKRRLKKFLNVNDLLFSGEEDEE